MLALGLLKLFPKYLISVLLGIDEIIIITFQIASPSGANILHIIDGREFQIMFC